jgi:hypothetical protein
MQDEVSAVRLLFELFGFLLKRAFSYQLLAFSHVAPEEQTLREQGLGNHGAIEAGFYGSPGNCENAASVRPFGPRYTCGTRSTSRVENRRSNCSLPVVSRPGFRLVTSVRFGLVLFPVPPGGPSSKFDQTQHLMQGSD